MLTTWLVFDSTNSLLMFMRCANVAAVDANRYRTVRKRLFLPIALRAFVLIELPLSAQFLLERSAVGWRWMRMLS